MQNVRSKVASKISKIKEADDFNFSNWLKKPAQHQYPVEAITSHLHELPEVQIEFIVPDNSEHKFDTVEPDVTDELKDCEFDRVRTNAIFFMIAFPSEEGVGYSNVEIKHQSFSTKIFEFLLVEPSFKKVKVKFDITRPPSYEFKIEVPESFNYLSDLVPEVFKIDLLEFEDLVKSAKKVNVSRIEIDKFKKIKIENLDLTGLTEAKKVFRIKVPSIGAYKFTQKEFSLVPFSKTEISDAFSVQLPKVKNWYANFTLSKGESFLLYKFSEAIYSSDSALKPADGEDYFQIGEQLSYILSNVKKVEWEKSNRLHIELKKYEEAAAKFLVENQHALLQDEFGIDIEKEVIAALKILFGNGVIKSALIITDAIQVGNPKFAKHLNLEIGWTDKLKKYCPELSFNLIQGNNEQRADRWNKSKSIIVADIDTALDDYHLKIFEHKHLSKFDCIVIDSVERILLKMETGNEFLSSIKPRILWATTSVLDKNIQRELNNCLDPSVKIEKARVRSKESIIEEAPTFVVNEFWCDADKNQVSEFKAALAEAKKDLRRVLESGNPLRFTANIFTIFHRLNQVGNFATTATRSPKTELLLKHITSIKENGKKALVLTQYEKFGIKKIEELFTGHGIKHIVAPNSLSAPEMKQAISTFKSQRDIVAFISDAKSTKLKFADIPVSFVIRFDQWWNPVANWELEDMFSQIGKEVLRESINILNYYSTGTLDQKIRELLLEDNLMNRNVFELMQAKYYEELISIDDWLKIFDMPVSTEDKSSQTPEDALMMIQKLTFDDFRKLLLRFFKIIGYSEVDILELPDSNSFNMIGKAQRNNRFFFLVARVFVDGKVDQSTIKSVLDETSPSKQDKVFIITRDSFPKVDDNLLRENVVMIDGITLAKFFIRFGILPKQK